MCQIAKLKIKKKCSTPEDPITVYIMWKGEKLGLCQKCWYKVSDSDLEWGDSDRTR